MWLSEYVLIKGNRWLEREMKTQRERAGFLPVGSSTGSDSGWDRQCSDPLVAAGIASNPSTVWGGATEGVQLPAAIPQCSERS